MYFHFLNGHLATATDYEDVRVAGATVVEHDSFDSAKTYTLVNGVVVETLTPGKLEAQLAEMRKFEYIGQRANAYPSLADQLDTLYHGGLEAWKSQIKAVKDKYPKPTTRDSHGGKD